MRQLLAIAGLGLAGLCHSFAAVAATVTYDQTKMFTLRPGGGVVFEVVARTFQHAWIKDPKLRWDFQPPVQPPQAQLDGKEYVADNGQIGQFGLIGKPMRENLKEVPPEGAVVPRSTASVTGPVNSATANSDVKVNPYPRNVITGEMHVFGEANSVKPENAYAFSSARVTAVGGNRGGGGRLDLRNQVRTATIAPVEGKNNQWTIWDPIYFESFDIDTGAPLNSGDLLKMFAQGDGNLTWSDDVLSLDAIDAVFDIDIDSAFTVEQGTLELTVAAGVVTRAKATGMFSTLVLPGLGHVGAFTMALRNDFALNYDLDPGHHRDLGMMFDFSGGGSAYAAAPEPGTGALVALGLVAALAAKRRQRRAAAAR